MFTMEKLQLCIENDITLPYFALGLCVDAKNADEQRLLSEKTEDDRLADVYRFDRQYLDGLEPKQQFICGVYFSRQTEKYFAENKIPTVKLPQLNEKAIELTKRENLKMFYSDSRDKRIKQIKKCSLTLEYPLQLLAENGKNNVLKLKTATCCPLVANELTAVKFEEYRRYLKNFQP